MEAKDTKEINRLEIRNLNLFYTFSLKTHMTVNASLTILSFIVPHI